ncbi:MAG: filamentous hemagglutinin N-terminal domain-containing protein [Xenococcus sp. (in: cyanobacteria)]
MSQTSPASAQITPDATLPNNSLAIPNANGDLITITGGTDTGNNLFHSFQEFSVLNGQTAFFDNSLTIENIFSRVTGGSISNIEGILSANGTANLFLINPNGIIFGPDASLNIGGSFIGSTADSIQFSDGSFYSAVDPQAPSLLTINIPLGLQYGAQPGNIIVQGNGNNTGFRDPSVQEFSLVKDYRPAGLQVSEGNTLALIGGNIALDGGNLTATAGHIELGSVTEGLVKFDASNGIKNFDYQDIPGFLDIALVNAASVEVSGNSSGTVNVQGQNITLTDASAILSNTTGDGTAGSITLNGTESVQVTGVSQNEIPFVSYVSTGTAPGSTGQGADLNINTSYLLVAGGAQVDSPVFGSGAGGTLTVNAERVELIAGSPVAGSSGLFAPIVPGATGEGGDINVTADSLLVAGGAQAFTLSVSSATAGDFNVKAEEIELNGTSPSGAASGLFANTFANGDAGNLNIETTNLVLTDGARIETVVVGVGTAGNITLKADTIELSGTANNGIPSLITASVEKPATGIGGDITIETNSLSLREGTQINSSVFGSGNGGNVNITASEINLDGYSALASRPSGLFATVYLDATGNTGNMTITTDNLRVSDGAQIAVSTVSSGSAGNLTLNVSDSVELTGKATVAGGGSSGLFSNAIIGEGNGGNINLATDQLIIKDGATISASNFSTRNANLPPGTGRAGNIQINAQTIELNGVAAETPASINASTFAGGGGNIVLNSQAMTATNGSQVTAKTSGEGAGGLIQVNTDNLSLSNDAVFSSSTSAAGDAGTISVTSNLLEISNQGTISTSSTGLGQAGNIEIASGSLNLDEGQITATSIQTGGGDITLVTDSIFLDHNSLISTSVLDSNGGGGNILIDNSAFLIGKNNSDIKADAIFGPGGNIQITAQGIFFDFDSEITASSKFGTDGIVEINLTDSDEQLGTVYFPDRISTPNPVIVSSCPVPESNTFTVTGSGGLLENPSSYLRGRTVWQDTRRLVSDSNNSEDIKSEASGFKSAQEQENVLVNPIVESQGWIINQRGKVELVAANTKRISPTVWSQEINCGDL